MIPCPPQLREMIDYPFMRTVRMMGAEWAAIEKRSEATLGSRKGLALAFRRTAPRVTKQKQGRWQEFGL